MEVVLMDISHGLYVTRVSRNENFPFLSLLEFTWEDLG